MTSYGLFDHAAREYVITDPRTPVKWINYIGTLSFGGFIDHTGGALLCKNDPALNRITKYIAQMPAADFKGTTLYIRTNEWDGYKLFSPFFVPCLAHYERWECHVGLGYSTFISQVEGLLCEVTVFVPQEADVEVRRIRVTNTRPEPVTVDVIPVVEYTHPNSLLQLTNADWVPQTMQSEAILEPNHLVVLKQYPFMHKTNKINYFTSNAPVDSYDTDRRAFLGENEYGTWASPASLREANLTNSEAKRGDNIAALLHALHEIGPGETREIITLLGQAKSLDAAQPLIDRFRQPAEVEAALKDQAAFWETFLSRQQVRTPDPALDAMLNVHNPHQCYTTKNWSRYLSLYQLGYGARGIGFRDSSQDCMGVIALAPAETLDLIRKLLSVQRRDGSAMHQFNPLTMEGGVGDSAEREDRPHYYSDDHLWIVQAVAMYLKETGDLAFLDEVIPYYEKDKAGKPVESGTVYDHLWRATEFTRKDTGPHGLPLLGFADWNDTINLPKGAESQLTACLYGAALNELAEICEKQGKPHQADRLRKLHGEMKVCINAEAWDGDWYVSYFDADGTPLGSHQNHYGQIYAYAQAWPVLAGFAIPERAKSALDAVEQRLNTRNGVKLSTPGYDGFDPTKGGVTTYPPGAKENSGIFLHVNPWVIIAETLAGSPERAYRYYHQINPAAKNEVIDEYECEPYVYPQNILADEHPLFGLARNSWLSGTASWMYQAGTRYILGVRPTYEGLLIDPCIPAKWDGFEVTRIFRGATYQIKVKNPKHVSKGVKLVKVDLKAIQGNVIPILPEGMHTVEVEMG
jgi:cellobiose phosphorylase